MGGGGGGGRTRTGKRDRTINKFYQQNKPINNDGGDGRQKTNWCILSTKYIDLSTSIILHNINQSTMNTHFIQAQDIIVDRRGSVFHELVDDPLLVQEPGKGQQKLPAPSAHVGGQGCKHAWQVAPPLHLPLHIQHLFLCKKMEYWYLALRHSDSNSSFKAALKMHLFNNYFWTVFHSPAHPLVWRCVCVCVCVCVHACVCVCACVHACVCVCACVVSVTVKCPELPPCVVHRRSRNPLLLSFCRAGT